MATKTIVIFHHDERGVVRTWSEIGKLVRCKDCYHYDEEHGQCLLNDSDFEPEDFCSYGSK